MVSEEFGRAVCDQWSKLLSRAPAGNLGRANLWRFPALIGVEHTKSAERAFP
jgi:hypothetical protein